MVKWQATTNLPTSILKLSIINRWSWWGEYIEVNEGVEVIGDDDEDKSLEIFVGKAFDNENDEYEAYNSYALSKGFGIRKEGLQRSKTTKNIIKQYYTCNKEGFMR